MAPMAPVAPVAAAGQVVSDGVEIPFDAPAASGYPSPGGLGLHCFFPGMLLPPPNILAQVVSAGIALTTDAPVAVLGITAGYLRDEADTLRGLALKSDEQEQEEEQEQADVPRRLRNRHNQ
ncbi:hypothetical protein F5Y00DRAFT_260879 [Daldinia vernicosa]|uniref:uncharacterized protein n=1 Tax=Daldinia vernicosa TaxID=114800 RepID=UPI002007FD9C|nr:uncharacterized protein F5Y00DRAFT_260879 [Daldinia vernicosa]KAI0850147.1 hypothetical protein F5Y00DRAFT_260879 [Daldinia vernicosa]